MDCSGSQLAGSCDMDAGMYTSCNSSDCGSPFTSNSSLDSLSGGGAIVRKKQRKLETHATAATSHKRSLSSSNGGVVGMGLKEMLCSATGGRNNKFTDEVTQQQAKRMRGDDRMVTTPQLLQQLMAPTKAHNASGAMGKPKASSRKGLEIMAKAEKIVCSRNEAVEEESRAKKKQQHQEQGTIPSNSVLMNLLVSGCDVSAGYMCMAPMRPRKTAKV